MPLEVITFYFSFGAQAQAQASSPSKDIYNLSVPERFSSSPELTSIWFLFFIPLFCYLN